MKKILILAAAVLLSTPASAHYHHHRHHFRHYHHHFRHAAWHRYHVRHYSYRHAFRHEAVAPSHDLIVSRAVSMGISRPVIEYVGRKESGFRCSPPGHYNGPLQILASTARAFGFRGGALNNCGAGLHYGLMHLSMCVSKYGNNPYTVAACHARGF